jgi:hypothetical protein
MDTGNFSLEETIELFPEILQKILEQMYDAEIDFEHNSKSFVSFCAYC